MKPNERSQHENYETNIPRTKEYSPYWTWILLFCIIAFVVYVRMRLLPIPLERDEGEYAYIGQLFLQGMPPYQEAFTMKLPGTSMIYALFMLLFGQTVTAIHLGLLLVNIASIILLFLLTKKWLCPSAGIVAAASFAMLTLSFELFGFAAHATHFVVLFVLGGLLTIMVALENKKKYLFFIAGILFGCAFLMKQPGILFFFFGLSILIFYRLIGTINRKEFFRFASFFVGGFLLPFIVVLFIIICGGTFDKFWFWSIQYAFEYSKEVTFIESVLTLTGKLISIWKAVPLFCLLTATGFMLVVTGRTYAHRTVILLLFGVFSFLAVLPGGNFRLHYFILIVPACSVLIGFGFQYAQKTLKYRVGWKYFPVLICTIVICENIYTNRIYYFIAPPIDIVQRSYRENHFAESITIGNFLAAHTMPDDRIAILGSEPQIYFYAKRRSASSHIYMYGMMEVQPYARKMQEEFIADVERVQPKFIVFFRIYYSWLFVKNSDTYLLKWRKEYIKKHCHLVGVVDLVDLYDVRYIWGTDATNYTPISQNAIFIFEQNQ